LKTPSQELKTKRAKSKFRPYFPFSDWAHSIGQFETLGHTCEPSQELKNKESKDPFFASIFRFPLGNTQSDDLEPFRGWEYSIGQFGTLDQASGID